MVDDDTLGLYASLARQCFINQYVFAASDGHIVLANSRAERKFGYARGELIGKPEMADDPRFSNTRALLANAADANARIAEAIAART